MDYDIETIQLFLQYLISYNIYNYRKRFIKLKELILLLLKSQSN